jgi:hypothetical protein
LCFSSWLGWRPIHLAACIQFLDSLTGFILVVSAQKGKRPKLIMPGQDRVVLGCVCMYKFVQVGNNISCFFMHDV